MKRKQQLAEIFKTLPWYDQLHILLIVKLRNLCKLRPVDMILPVVIVQAVSMIVFLPSRDLFSHALMSLITVAIAILPGLAKPILSTNLVK